MYAPGTQGESGARDINSLVFKAIRLNEIIQGEHRLKKRERMEFERQTPETLQYVESSKERGTGEGN